MIALNDCPFCGSKALIVSVGGMGTEVGCINGNCEFTIHICGRDNLTKAVTFWNRLSIKEGSNGQI